MRLLRRSSSQGRFVKKATLSGRDAMLASHILYFELVRETQALRLYRNHPALRAPLLRRGIALLAQFLPCRRRRHLKMKIEIPPLRYGRKWDSYPTCSGMPLGSIHMYSQWWPSRSSKLCWYIKP